MTASQAETHGRLPRPREEFLRRYGTWFDPIPDLIAATDPEAIEPTFTYAVHTSARDMRDTDWLQVVALYDQLVRLDPSPIIALNRAIAVAELDGPNVALTAVHRLEDKLAGYHAYHATRADLLRRLGRNQQARAAYDKAIELAGNTAETAYLIRRRDQLA
jgi:RNA polymerase sigma-70 factor (ECF subfamily)